MKMPQDIPYLQKKQAELLSTLNDFLFKDYKAPVTFHPCSLSLYSLFHLFLFLPLSFFSFLLLLQYP